MTIKPKHLWLIMLFLAILVSSCQGTSQTVETERSDTPSEQDSEDQTSSTPSAAPFPAETPTATLVPPPTPTPVVLPAGAISVGNVSQIEELWRIGNGDYEEQTWSHDSQYAALGTGAGIFVLDALTGDQLFFHPVGTVEHIAFSFDGTVVAAGVKSPVIDYARPSRILTYALPSGEELGDIDLDFDLEAMAFHENGNLVAVGPREDRSGQTQHIAIVHYNPISSAAVLNYQIQPPRGSGYTPEISDDGVNLLMHFPGHPTLDLFDTFGQRLGSIPIEDRSSLHMNGGFIALNTWEEIETIQVYRGNGAYLGEVDVRDYPGAMYIDTAGENLHVNVRSDILTYSLPELQLQNTSTFTCCISEFSPDITRNISGSWELSDIATGEVLGKVSNILDPAQAIAISPDHSKLVAVYTGYDDDFEYTTKLQVWDTSQMEIEKNILYDEDPGWGDEIERMNFLDDGKTLVIHKDLNASLEFWDIGQGEQVDTFSFSHEVYVFGISQDGGLVIGALRDVGVEIWDRQTSERLVDEDGIYQYIGFYSAAFTPDGKTAIINGSDTMMIWDLETRNRPVELEGNGRLTINPDGDIVAHHYYNQKQLHFYDLSAHQPISVYEWLPDIRQMLFSFDGSLLILNTYTGIFFWDVDAGEVIDFLEYAPLEIMLSEDGTLLVTYSYDGTIRLWGIP